MIAIIDYDAGNIMSVQKACAYLGRDYILTRDRKQILTADHVILPGVGAFADAMMKLRGYGLEEVIGDTVRRGTPFLGICLGLQLLFERSDESLDMGQKKDVPGLGLLKGDILRISDQGGTLKVPHMGWNSLTYPNRGRLFEGIPDQVYVYFVHSYYLKATDSRIVTAKTQYGVSIDASVEKDNLFACQFHPEKSGRWGLKILENFLKV